MVTTTNDFDTIVEGMTGADAADAINAGLNKTFGTERYTFGNSDVVDGVISHTHTKNTLNVQAKCYDSSGVEQNIAGLFTVPNANSWVLAVNAILTESFTLIVSYQ